MLVRQRELLVLEEALRVLQVVLDVGDAAVNLGLGLKRRLAHLLCDEPGKLGFVRSHDLAESLELVEASVKAGLSAAVLSSVGLVRALDAGLELCVGHRLDGGDQLVVLGVDGAEEFVC